MPYLRQSTAQTIRFGPCLDKTDGVSEEAALTLAQADMRLSKDGGAFAQKSAAGNATHDSDGWYSTALSTTDTDTVGELILNVHQPANMLPVWLRWWVLEEAVYDALFGAAAAGFDASGRVDVGSWLGTAAATPTVAGVPEVDITHLAGIAQSLLDLKDFADSGYDPATNKVQGVVLVDTTTVNTDMVAAPPTLADIADAVWDEGVAGHVAVGSFGKTDADVLADTNELQADDVPGLIAALPTAAVVADAVWDELRAAHVIAGSFGEGVVVETNSDKTGYAIAVGGIAATSFAAGAINAAATSTDFINEIWAKICEDQGSYTAQQILSILLSACAGVTAAATFKTANGVSSRITATLNASEERTAITLAPSAGA